MKLHLILLTFLAPLTLSAQTPPAPLPNPALIPPGTPANNVFKTLDQVEPRIPVNATNTPGDADSLFKITQSGSYYLTNNIEGVSGKYGIEIAVSASYVTLDLMGFTLAGVAGSLSGIQCNSSYDFSVENGTVRGWGHSGIAFGGPSWSARHRINRINAVENGAHGIDCDTLYARVTHCLADINRGTGIRAGGGWVSDCISTSNGKHGIEASNVIRCNAIWNSSKFTEQNGEDPVTVEAAGIKIVGSSGTISDNFCFRNAVGISAAGTGNVISHNRCLANSPDGTTDKDYVIAAGNIVGTIVKTTTTNAISGNSGGGSGTTDPFANFAD